MNKRMIALGAVGALLGMSACFAEDAYIESDGTQAIDTRYKLKSTTRIEIDFQFTSVYGQNSVFGNYTGNDLGVRFYVGGATDTPANWSFVYGYKSASEDPGWYNIVHCDTERHTAMIDFACKTAEFDDRMGTLDASVIRDDVESSVTLSVFGQKYSNGTISLIPKMKLYSFRIYESGTPVRDYVPCLRDGVAGLYDKVGKTFVANYKPAETGFSSGGDIMTISDTDAYIESNGKTLVNLLERFGPKTRYEVDFKPLRRRHDEKRGRRRESLSDLCGGGYAASCRRFGPCEQYGVSGDGRREARHGDASDQRCRIDSAQVYHAVDGL